MSTVSGKDVATNMSIWTRKVGYPIITVQEFEAENKILVRQDRFLNSRDASTEENETIYPVSLGLVTGTKASEEHDILLDSREMHVQLKDMTFFKINSIHAGFFRTLYTPQRLLKLGEAMHVGLLSVEDRIGVIADASALASSGYQNTSALLGMLANLRDEDNPFVWMQINSSLRSIRIAFKFQEESIRSGLKRFTRLLVGPQATALGWDFNGDDDISMAEYKAEMFQAAALADEPR